MNILVTGAKGQLGQEIMDVLTGKALGSYAISGIYDNYYVLGTGREDMDISNIKSIRNFLKHYKPDIIINAAAFTNVDLCESMKDEAFKVNSLGAKNVAQAAEEEEAKLVHISTDYVFSGESKEPYREYDRADPQNVYGKTKFLGEEYIKEFCSRHFVIRTSWLYGRYGKNFVKTIIKTAKEKGELKVVDDQRGTPTNAEDLVQHILKIAVTDDYGTYHCSGNGECTWFEFAKKIVEYSNIDCKIEAITSGELHQAAKRPACSVLDNMMLRCTVGDGMRNWDDALKDFLRKRESLY